MFITKTISEIEKCELKILELWLNKDSEEFKTLCSSYFQSKTITGFKDIYDFMKTIFIGYLGDEGQVRNFLKQFQFDFTSKQWNERLSSPTSIGKVVKICK